ncbi:MAG: class I SAM-dependent methyltransferase [Mycobacteriaceae bacterium]|nr:class I SAM-dependent methyltransferase [Mycobacteriaceae bacterium]
MPRTDDDSWDITQSVGRTALGVAAARAAETARPDPLIRDRFAQQFLDAAGEGLWTEFSKADDPTDDSEVGREARNRRQLMIHYMACRTALFDEFFLAATDAGIRQVVIAAAGLDSRAWRLPWPNGTTVYEIDQAAVLEFKSTTLQAHGEQPACARVAVPVDLRHDWPQALRTAQFDPAAPTAWSTEGLLPYLPATAQDLLFERIDALSADGSRLAVESMPADFPESDWLTRRLEQMQRFREADIPVPDVQDLWYLEERTDVAGWLRERGWDVTVEHSEELLARYRRTVPDDVADAVPPNRFITARRTRPRT